MNHVNKMNHSVAQRGFTLIELMLAMSGVAFLLLAIAMTTMQISNTYSKGMTIKSVNQTGRDLSDMLQRDIKASKPFNLASTSSYLNTPYGGRLCLGKYSYAWNYGTTLAASGTVNKIIFDDSTPVRMARVLDIGGQICANAAANQSIARTDATELLTGSDKLDLALHTFTITSSATDAIIGQALYSASFALGTSDQQAIKTSDASCKPPSDNDSNWAFCAVNVFDFTTRAGNKA